MMALTEAQKRAHAAYNKKIKEAGARKNITISLSAEEAAEHRAVMEAHGLTPIQVWRKAIQNLKNQE